MMSEIRMRLNQTFVIESELMTIVGLRLIIEHDDPNVNI